MIGYLLMKDYIKTDYEYNLYCVVHHQMISLMNYKKNQTKDMHAFSLHTNGATFELLSTFSEYYVGIVFAFNTGRHDFTKLYSEVQLCFFH